MGQAAADFKVCELGMEQTPIDLRGGVAVDLGGIRSTFQEMPLQLLHNGHTIQVNCPAGSFS
ncbi:MAG: hypothetical protein EXQ85_09945 [Alphaproteobacteria bacterium]|nr:hypothetical protein [Alphaproteobacteria bacterium]